MRDLGAFELGATPAADAGGSRAPLGTAGAESLVGGSGVDLLVAAGNDTLTGGGGMDLFVFKGLNGVATVTDFAAGDLLLFNEAVFGSGPDALLTGADLAAAGLRAGQFFLDTDGPGRGELYYDTSNDPMVAPVLVAYFQGTSLPGAGDLLFTPVY